MSRDNRLQFTVSSFRFTLFSMTAAIPIPTFHYERDLIAQGFELIAGVDEAGCGAWAGPVYAAAVILPLNSRIKLIRDSKRLTRAQREVVITLIKKKATAWSIGIATHQEVDELNIRQAAFLATRRALNGLTRKPQAVLSDGYNIPELSIPCTSVIGGDKRVKSIAAASVIAKIHRDKRMEELEKTYPGYGFADHKGYGTKKHQQALAKLGVSPIHRKSYAPIKALL